MYAKGSRDDRRARVRWATTHGEGPRTRRVRGPSTVASAAGADELGLVTAGVRDLVVRDLVVVVEHARLVEAVLAGEDARRLVAVDLADPRADEDGRDGVAGEVRQRAGLAHEAVDADDEADARHEVWAVRLEATGKGRETRTADARGALARDDHEDEEADLLADAERLVHRLGDEEARHRQVDRGAVEVEGVAGRDGDADDRTGDAEVLHLGDEARQDRLRRRRRQDEEELAAEVAEEREDVHPRDDLEDAAEEGEDEDRARRVEGEHEQAQALERADAGGADEGGHGAERADRGGPHDHRHEAEDEALEVLDGVEDRLAGLAHLLEREADEERDEQGLEHRARRQRGDERVGDEPEDEVDRALRLGGDLRLAGLPDRADAEHDRAEDDRRDHHLDEVDEAGPEGLEVLAHLGEGPPHEDARHHGDDDGDVEEMGAVALGGRARLGVDGAVGGGTHGDLRWLGPALGVGPVNVTRLPRPVTRVTVVFIEFSRRVLTAPGRWSVAGLAGAYGQAQRAGDQEAIARALAVAGTMAATPDVVAGVQGPDPSAVLQPYAERVRVESGTDFVVVMSRDGIRYTHPDPTQIGKKFLGHTEEALAGGVVGEDYTGTLGPSSRVVVPVTDQGKVVALVSVGIRKSAVGERGRAQLPGLLLAGLVAALLSGLGTGLVSRRIKRQTHGLDEQQLREIYQYYDAVLHAVTESLVITDLDGHLRLANDEATRLLALPTDAVGRPVAELGLAPALTAALTDDAAHEDELHVTSARVLVLNRGPARWQGRLLGHVATLRDRTDLEALTGELDSARGLTEALRSQAHESANRLHTIVSLIELGHSDRALG